MREKTNMTRTSKKTITIVAALLSLLLLISPFSPMILYASAATNEMEISISPVDSKGSTDCVGKGFFLCQGKNRSGPYSHLPLHGATFSRARPNGHSRKIPLWGVTVSTRGRFSTHVSAARPFSLKKSLTTNSNRYKLT